MAETDPLQVFQALMDAARTMTGTRPGWDGPYPNQLKVFEGNPEIEQVNQLPALGIEVLGMRAKIELSVGGQVGVRHEMDVGVVGYVQAAAGVGVAMWRLRLWDDYRTTVVYANDVLGGLITLMEDGPTVTDGGTLDNKGEFKQILTLHFFETKLLEVTP